MTDLAELIELIARHFFGEPNKRMSNKRELRFGPTGVLSIDLKKGIWFDHKSTEGGGVLALIRREKGFHDNRECFEWLEAEGYRTNGDASHVTRPERERQRAEQI
jgi:hypothetical protein